MALAVMGALFGCSSGDGDGKADGEGAHQRGPAPSEKLAKLNVPDGYSTTKGWQQTLGWVPPSVGSLPVTTAEETGAVAYLRAASGGYSVEVRAAESGDVRWSGKNWQPPVPTEGISDDLSEDEEIPDVISTVQADDEYIVAWAHGLKGKDELHEGTEVVQLAVYPAKASGSGVKPARVINVPVSASSDDLNVAANGDGLLITWGDGQGVGREAGAAVDVASGKVTRYQATELLPKAWCEDTLCTDGRVWATAAAGPVISSDNGGFGVPGSWFSNDHAPAGVKPGSNDSINLNGDAQAAAGEHLVAVWNRPDGTHVWAVHDATTGRVKATTTCSTEDLTPGMYSEAYPAVASSNDRYVAAGPVAFDLKTRRGWCLAGDDNRKEILLLFVTDRGTAFGGVNDGDDGVPAQVSLRTGQPKALSLDIDVPWADVDGSGMFLTRDKNKALRISVLQQE
ncbi:hypothetical protein [Streptomyces boninensis]|uniref:hypothetical protein n=1 Tax=Streptomyces boninensis TaxID=2039455 RepID=UPI003B21299D